MKYTKQEIRQAKRIVRASGCELFSKDFADELMMAYVIIKVHQLDADIAVKFKEAVCIWATRNNKENGNE
jgi:hypothetical protein